MNLKVVWLNNKPYPWHWWLFHPLRLPDSHLLLTPHHTSLQMLPHFYKIQYRLISSWCELLQLTLSALSIRPVIYSFFSYILYLIDKGFFFIWKMFSLFSAQFPTPINFIHYHFTAVHLHVAEQIIFLPPEYLYEKHAQSIKDNFSWNQICMDSLY